MPRGRRIGRIKYLPPDPETAQKYLLPWSNRQLYTQSSQIPQFTSRNLFGNDSPLEFEIGCGTGEYLCSLAEANREINYLGVDNSLRSLYLAGRQAEKSGLDNIRFHKADIRLVYPFLAPDSLAAVYLHFPDPSYGKKRIKHRLFDRNFLTWMKRVLTAEGRVHVVTDQTILLNDMLALVEEDGGFERTHEEPYLIGFEPSVKSRFQRAWERHGQAVYRFELRKKAEKLPVA